MPILPACRIPQVPPPLPSFPSRAAVDLEDLSPPLPLGGPQYGAIPQGLPRLSALQNSAIPAPASRPHWEVSPVTAHSLNRKWWAHVCLFEAPKQQEGSWGGQGKQQLDLGWGAHCPVLKPRCGSSEPIPQKAALEVSETPEKRSWGSVPGAIRRPGGWTLTSA